MNTSLFEKIKIPHVFVLLTAVVLACSLLTYILPSGQYERETKTVAGLTRDVIKPGTFTNAPKQISASGLILAQEAEAGNATPVSIQEFLSAIPRGMEKSADIIFFIFLIGGVLGILQATGTVAAIIQKLIDIFGGAAGWLTVFLMFLLAVGGSTLGMGEEFIPLVPLFLIVSKELGYDRLYGVAIVILAADVGFAAATLNPFTVTIAQGIAELPLNADVPFRSVFFIFVWGAAVFYLLRYGNKIRKDPSASLMAGDDFDISRYDYEKTELESKHLAIVVMGVVIFSGILWSIQNLGWWMAEMGGGFLLIGIVAVLISGMTWNKAAAAFVKGMEEMVVAALVVGFARGIEVVLQDGMIMDTIIYYAASTLQQVPNYIAAGGMLVFQSILNFLIPSGSGQAAVTMPIMAPLADLLQLRRETAVFAFTCGDGFSNTIVPTSGVLMAILSLGEVPYTTWLRFMFPLFLQLMAISAIFLFISVIFPGVWAW